MQPDNYEFTPEQEKTIHQLATLLRWAGFAFLVLGTSLVGLATAGAMATQQLGMPIDWGQFAYLGSQAVMHLIIGAIMLGVSRSFFLVATTAGHDIKHLMTALTNMIGMKRIQVVLLALVAIYTFVNVFSLLKLVW
jgi:hypothetical protein